QRPPHRAVDPASATCSTGGRRRAGLTEGDTMDEHRFGPIDRREEDRGGRRLDEEGIPDLEGPLPEKAATGDPQEGHPPPSDRPASLDWGTTRAEEAGGEPLDVRLSHEVPEVDGDEWADEQLDAGDAVARD